MNNKTKKIVIADDDQEYLREISKKLEQTGLNVFSTSKGKEVIKLARRTQPNLILLDIMMTDRNGYQVIEDLKKSSKTRKIPIMMLSDLGHGEAIEKSITRGAQDYVIKENVTPEELVDKVNQSFLEK